MTIRLLEDLAIEFKSKGESSIQTAEDMASASASGDRDAASQDIIESKILLFALSLSAPLS